MQPQDILSDLPVLKFKNVVELKLLQILSVIHKIIETWISKFPLYLIC